MEVLHRSISQPYTIAGINVIAADTDEEARRLSTSSLKMILGVLTQNMDYLQPPVDYTREFEELAANPAVQRMMKYAFFGSQQAVEEQTKQFIQETAVDEVIVSSHIFEHQDRLKSYELFAQVMQQINEEVLV